MIDGRCMMEDGNSKLLRNRIHFREIKNFIISISPA